MSLMDSLVGLRFRDTGPRVELLQRELVRLGWPIAVDGIYGAVTSWHVNRVCIEAGVSTVGGDRVTMDAWRAIHSSQHRGVPLPDPTPSSYRSLLAWAKRISPRIAGMLEHPDRETREAYTEVMRQLATLPLLREVFWEQGPLRAVAFVNEWLYARDVREVWGQNRGDWVDILIELGGGDHNDAPSWCAYGQTAARRLVCWVLYENKSDLDAYPLQFPVTGRAAAIYGKAPLRARSDWTPGSYADIRGACGVRGRTSEPVSDRDIIRAGNRVGAHTFCALGWRAQGVALCVGFNSSGTGHDGAAATSRAHARGRAALEVITEHEHLSPQGYQAWLRFAGWAHCTLTPE